jgi:hypothetical protein
VQGQSLVPADLRDIGRDVPSRSATVLGTRQGATEQQQQLQGQSDARERAQPRKLDLFRSCSDVEAAAADLEADIPPGAGRRCCRVVEQGAAVRQLMMWRRVKARRSLSALVVIGSWFSSKRRNGGEGEHKRGLRRHVEHDSGAQ